MMVNAIMFSSMLLIMNIKNMSAARTNKKKEEERSQ